jgi:predicted regulator of Ras-like GTPase activity (Roadblock/LC7/MglB family)
MSGWWLHAEDVRRLQHVLGDFLADASARTALLVDRGGQLIATVGEDVAFDATTLASLAAADFTANDQLARLLGEPEFGALVHQGERDSMYLLDVSRRAILVVLFDARTTLGLVKLRSRPVLRELQVIVTDLLARGGPASGDQVETGFAADAAAEIDKLFGV